MLFVLLYKRLLFKISLFQSLWRYIIIHFFQSGNLRDSVMLYKLNYKGLDYFKNSILVAGGNLAKDGVLTVDGVLSVDGVPLCSYSCCCMASLFLLVSDIVSIPHRCSFLLPFSGVPVPAVAGLPAVAGFLAVAGALLMSLMSLPAY
jgi:hypothetical protein